MAEDKVTNLYNAFVKNGYAMEPEAQFRENLKDPSKRKAAYDALVADGYNMEPFADFENNIGFGAPASSPVQQQQAQPTATTTPASAPAPAAEQEQEQAPVQSEPEQQAWEPTVQERIQMSYNMFTMLNDFNQRSKARMEQIRRLSEPFTPEGRQKRKAMEFQSRLAGTPTKVMGLTPPTYGVKYIDGKPVTQWLLPDGRLTTNLIEADQAEYGARTARLRHQFENRMKQNGLDPANPEDVEMQAQFDAQAPAYGVVADLWREAEEQHKADRNRNAMKHWDNYAAMGGGREMRIVTTSMNRHDDNISHMTRFDLEKMMDNAWARVGSQVTANCYNRLRQQYPGASEEELQATASQMARSLSDNAVYQYAVQQNTPKSTLEYFGRTVADMNVINSISKGLARSQAGTSGDLAAYEAAMGEYGKNHRVAQVAGTVVGMGIDPVTWVSGGVGSLAGKGAINLGGRFVASRAATSMSTQVGSRLFSSSLTGRIITGAAAGGGNFATYEMLKEGESQFLHGGHVNAETGEVEGYSAGAVLKAGGHGLVLGSVTGTLSPMIGNVADKYVKATTSTAGKVGVRFGEVAVSTLAEGTIFSVPQWISGEGDAFDVWTDNMAMMLGFKAQHGIKSAPRVIASLRPIKPTNGRPLTQAERNHIRMDFEERLRRNLDASPSDLSFTADEREELRRAGYGELMDLFSRDRVETQNPNINPAEGAIELRAERVEAETIHRSPEFDGYSAMEELMQDGRVSQAARAKAYYILTGRMLPMGSVAGYTTTKNDDGSVIVNSTTANGEIVTSRTFKNEQEAKQETDNIMRQAELNTIDVGERYKEAVADDMVLDAAISEVSPGADPATIKKIYRAVKAGNKDVTESQKQLVEFLDDAMERNRDIADRYRPEAIRAELMNETGIDVDAVLRKMPSKRTEAEQEVVKSYLERLYPEEARQHNAEPTPEQSEVQSQYEQGRLLYGRFEEGDPTVQADVDAIALRMQEAYQAIEDVFGAEAEYYMFHVNENPWALVNEPDLTAEQQDAVLYYINAKAALDGIMDASNEAADRKRAEVEQSVAKRTHKDNGMVNPATMKVGDRQVYVVKGDVVMFPDGTAVDVRNSSESVVVMDAQTGEYEFTSPDQIFKVSEAVNPQDELDTALSVIEQEQMNVFGDNAIAPEEPATADTEAYDRGYEQGIEVSTSLTDEVLNDAITDLRGRDSLSDEWRGRLEAYEYEQQRRVMEAQSVPESPESVLNPTETAVSEGEIAPEAVSSVENGQQTALSRIPTNEQGEPVFEAVDKDTAWDGLVEAVGGEADAADIAMAQVQQASTDLEALKKKQPTLKAPKLKGSPMAMAQAKREAAEQYQRDLAQYNQQIADTQARLDAWNGIVGVYNSRNAELRRQQEEERRQRDAEAHDAAVARFEEEQRIKAEKQAEQERIGVHAVNPKIRDKWNNAPKIEGHTDAITLPDGSIVRGRYVLTEAGAASPSHDVNNAYMPTEGFPIDENGQSVNDRDYMRDKDAQRKVEGMAGNYDNRALQDPVIVSKDGVVLSGNNRTMSGDLAARQGTDKAYVDYLREFGHKYGFTPEQVQAMSNPRLVFVPEEDMPYDATTFSRFNAQEKKSQGKPEAAVKLGKIVPDNVFTSIVNDISRYDRLSDYYADEKAIAHALGALMQAGVINDMQMPELRTGTALSATGKELIENTLIGKVFQTSPDAVRQIISMPTLRQSIVMGLNEIANNRTLARNGYDISEELAKAVDLVTRAKAAMPDVYIDGMPVSPFGRMQGLFDDEFGDSRVTDDTALLLADILNSGKPSDLRKVLTAYNNEAAQASGGQIDIFSGTIPTKEEILTNVNQHYRNATPREQQALVDAAIAERKRRAEAETEQRGRDQESEQTPNDAERGAEPQQPTAVVDEELTPEEQALAARVEVTDNDWAEGDGDTPTYKRDIIIDGTHKVTQVDAPDDGGHYTGTFFEFNGKRFGDIAEIARYIDGGMKSEPTEAQKAAGNYKDDVNMPTALQWSNERAGNGEPFLVGTDGSIDLVEIEQEVFDKMGIDKAPFRLTPSMVAHVYERHKKELKLNSPEDAVEAILDVMNNFDHVRQGRENTYIFSVEGTRSISARRAVTFVLEYDKGEWLGIKTVGYDRIPNLKELTTLWEKSEEKSSATGVAPANVSSEQPSQGNKADGIASNQSAVISDGKGNTLSADKQTDGVESSLQGKAAQPITEPYTITPTTYTTKKGKVLDMHLVKFAGTLTKEQQRAAKELAKAEKGWYDREQGGFMMRSEESAKQLADTILNNDDAVSDAQPVSLADTRKIVKEYKPSDEVAEWSRDNMVESIAQRLAKDTAFVGILQQNDLDTAKQPAISQSVTDDLLSNYDLMESGFLVFYKENFDNETAKRVFVEDVTSRVKEILSPKERQTTNPSGNRLVTDERYAELRERMRKKLGGQMNIGIDPEILAIGTEMAVYHLEKGARKFTEYAKVMIADLGDAIRPYLKAFYNGARELPEVMENGLATDMTPYDEVQTFDVANFDKSGIDVFATAETVTREAEVAQEVEVAQERIKKTRSAKKETKKKAVTLQQSSELGLFDSLFDNETDNEDGLQRNDATRSEGVSANGNRHEQGLSRGSETGSQLTFDGRDFGDLKEIAQYIDGGMQSEPTEAQKAAGNYRMEHRRVDGYNISIENPKGSVRRGTGADGKPWETTMQNDYGYIRGTQGVDGDHIDVFLSDTPEQGDVYVIDQVNEDGSFDEHKVMYGFPSEQAAREAYLSNYEPGWTGLGAITHISKDEFKKWIGSSKRKTKPFTEYKSVRVYKEQNPQLVIEPDGFSDFGPVFTQFKGNAQGAIKVLSELQDGEAIGALHHKDIGDIDLVWGNAGTAKSDGFGLAKLVKYHPEVVEHLQEILDDMHIVKRSENRINLESDTHKAAVRLTWNKERKKWLLTAFEKKETPKSIDKTTDTGDNPTDLRGGTALSQNSGVSDGKVNTLSADKQTDGVESSLQGKAAQPITEPYTITPAVYVGKSRGGKPGKETPMHRVTFNRPLTAEQERAVKAFANEAIGEKKGRFATKRGWADREAADGSWLFRTEEDARKVGEMIGNEEAVADAQPMTAEELREAVAPAENKPAAPANPNKAPINRVSLEDVMTDLSTKGETKLSDHAEPVKAEPETQYEISDEEMQSLANELRDLLGIGEDEGDADIKFRDPGELTAQERQRIQSAGIRMAMGLVERGTTSFPDYAAKMVAVLGDKIRPWLKSFYEGARWTPGYEKYSFTPTEQVAVFDVQNFDKKQADPIAQAAMIVEERKAGAASAQAQKELTETRNKNRRENDKQREADTVALAEKAEAVASEAENIAKTSADAGELNRASELIDQTLDKVNDQLALLGYYEAVEDDSKFHESYGYMLTAEKKAVADAAKLAKQLVNDLGIDIKVTSATTPLGRKSVKKGTAVRANIAPAGGDIIINLPLNEGRELAIYIGLEPVAEKGTRRRGDNLAVERILYRVENPNGSGMERWGHNWYAPVESTYAEFLRRVKEITRDYLPSSTPAKEPQAEAYHGTVTLKDGREAVVIAANHVQNIGEPPQLTDYIVGVKGEPGTIKISSEEIAHAGAPAAEDKPSIPAKSEETHNGYKVGDEVMWDRYGNGKWEKQRIADFDKDGRPIFDSMGMGMMMEIGDWERVKPADGIFGEAQRVARATQEKKKATADAAATLTGNKSKKSRKKDVTLQPEQPIGDLFGGLFDNPQNASNHEETEMGTRPGEAGGQRQQLKQDTQVGGDEPRRETERPAGEAGSGSTGLDSGADRAGSRGLHDVATQPALERLPEKERKNVHNNHAERGVDYAPKGEDARIKANIEAIELAKRLLDAGETATPEQMAVLRRFSGWGGLGKAFNEEGYTPNPTAKRLRELLGEQGYQDAVDSRRSAYYTPAEVIDTMWDVARALGFKGGNVLEGSAGIGNILGLMPSDMSERSSIHAVEIDSTTGGILSLLYPDAKVEIQGFEKTRVQNGSVDLAITNVPFITGAKVFDETGDKDLSKKFRDIHDFCIAKNIRKLREGGIGIFITSSGTMDNSKELRRWLINEGNADVVGAFRMHNKTFGGTGATSDIIIVRKRVNGKPSPNAIDVTDVVGVRVADYDTGDTRKVKGQEVPIVNRLTMDFNKYFAEHPENMAGEMRFGFEEGETFRPKSKALYPVKGKEQGKMLTEWAERFADMEEESSISNVEDEVTRINEQLGEGVKEGSMVLNSQGELCMARMGEAVPLGLNKNKVKGHTKAECFNAYTAIKKALSDVLEYQSSNDDNEGLAPLLKELNRAFDSFTRTYGNLHKNTAISFLRNDVDFSSILALETYSEKGDKKGNKVVKVGKTDIFSRRVIETEKEPQPTTIKDAILASLYKSGGVDVEYIGQALGKSTDDVKREIVESGLGFENPSTGTMEVSYKYLSGNVREKLHIAQENNEGGRYDANIKALESVMPMTIPAHLIEFALGSSWIEPKLYEDFVYEKTGIRVKLTNVGGTWFMKTPWSTFNEKNRAMAVVSKMCDKTIMGHELIESAITNKQITVSKTTKHYDGTTETITDKTATAECGIKVDEIRAEFKDWAREHMQADPEMSARIEHTYNERFNNYVPMSIPDEFVPQHFGGHVSELHGSPFALRPHQGRAVVRGTTEPVLLAHEVGTGKTYTLITTAMEMRRLGTARKPMIVVQNATVGQFVESAKEIYPNAKVLTIEEADRTAEGRKNFYAKIKYNDWDMIVIPQSVFERIPDSPEREMTYVKDIIEEKMKVLEAMREADSDGRSMIVRQAEKDLAEQEERLAELTEVMQGKKKKRDEKKEATTRQNAEVRALEMLDREVDDVENFDDMGIDAILVDEAHEYKHLGFSTAMQRGVKGVDPSYSKKSQGVFLKAQAVMERNNGRNVVFATGTPISNTAAEIWTFMRYLMPVDTMKANGIYYFDDFVRNFGNIAQTLEFINGRIKEVNRFAGYVNLPELIRIWSSVADTVLTKDAGGVSDKIPDMEGGKPQDIYLPQTRALRSVMKYIRAELERYDSMTGKEKKENSHIPMTMHGVGTSAAVDVRLVVPNAEDDPNSKTNAAVRETLRSLKDSAKYRGTVAIFADRFFNKESKFNLYEDIREKLIAEGVPADQIVVIKSGMTVKKKLDIFEKVNAGEIRVIMGSTSTLGTGVNIQERLHTLMHMDAPNRPMDYTQRNGRILRQGNLHKDMCIPVRVIRFGVEDSADVTAYQRLKTKGAISDSVMDGSKLLNNSMENRVVEEMDDQYGDMLAILSGSEYAILKNQAEREVRSLTAKQKGHDIDQIYVHNQLPKVEGFIKGAEHRIALETKNLKIIDRHFPDGTIKKITIGKFTFDSVGAMEDFFKEQNAKMNEAAEAIREGADNYTSRLTVDVDGLQFEVTTTVGRAVDSNGQGTLTFEPERNVTYSCEALGIKDATVKGNRIKNVMQKIAEDIATGKDSRELLNRGQQQLAHYIDEYRLLQERNGREFPYKTQLAEARERLAKYEEAMKKELEEKEAKYAEMDKSVEAASDITLTDEDSADTPTSGDGKFRDGEGMTPGERLRAIRALEPIEVERNNMSKAELREVYNNLPTVEKDGREIEFYRSAFKKVYHDGGMFGQVIPLLDEVLQDSVLAYSEEDSLGGVIRPDGTVHKEHTNVIAFDNYVGKVRIDGKDYYARMTVQNGYDGISGMHSCFVTNVELYEKTTIGDSSPGYPRATTDDGVKSTTESRTIPITPRGTTDLNGIVDAKLQQFFETASSEAMELDKADRVKELSEKLNTPVRVITERGDIDNLPSARHRRAKGYFDPATGEVVVVVPNNVNVSDVENTVIHEVVGHKGLRAFIGEERFDEFLGEVYDHASNPIRKVIDKKTDDMVNAEADRLRVRKAQARERAGEDVNSHYYTDMAEARVESEAKRDKFRKEATEEYMADLGGRIGSEGFEKMSRDELTLWGKIKAKVQSFLDKFLRGLKIAKSIRLNDKDLSYILFKSWKNMREKQGKGGVFADAEDVVMRRRTGYDADDVTRFRDPGLGLEETITKMKAEAMQANAGNLQTKRDAMRAIGGNLNHLRQAMARQREYDITTVKSVADLARVLMDANLLDDLSKYETKRILGAINNVVGRQDVSQYVQKVMDIMVDNQLRMGANTLGRLLSIRGSRVDARGIEVQGELDPDGQRIAQVVRKATTLPKDDIDNRIAEAINRMSSTDQAIADEATLEYAGLQIARQYVEDITESKAEEKALRDSIKQAKEDKDAGQMTESAYRQYVASTEDAIRQNKIERAEAFHSLVEQVGSALGESVERAKAWREAEKQRVEEIHHNANSDMEGRPTDEHHKDDRTQKLANNSGVRFLLAPLATFDQMLRMFGKKNTRGEGYLWNRYMRGWVSATEREYTGYRDALKVLDAKVSEIYGKDMKWGDLFSIDRKLPKASVRFFDGGEMKDHELTQGNLLYIYMADKMSDGRMKLRRMGITEEDIEDIKNFLDPKFIQLADWMQEEFLVDKRNEYNEVHKRMFGASMAAIENYFPLKILANARLENVDVADDTTDTALPATSTGSIIKRRRNNLALDVTGANAFSVILDHLQQMERWAAFAEFNRDLNTLLSYKRFRNQVMNMSSVYGGGKTLWNNFRNVCRMAAGAYRPPIADLDKMAVNIAKGVTAAKVSFRLFTALKQFLSMPAYISDSNPMYLAANIANPIGAWRWSMENLPLFEKRWRSRMAGDPRLLKSDMDWKMWRSRIVEIASRVGMSPNAFVDALTVAIGAHSMYQTKLAKYKRQGYDPDVAEERAKQDATILFNQTQQSSEGAFLSTMQVDRSWLSVLFTVFRNSSMSYTRQLYDSIRNIGRRFTPGYKELSEEFMAKQMRRDGIDPYKADRNAKQEYRRGIIRDIVRVGVFGYVLQLAWNLGAYLPYLILGEDEEEKDKMWQDVWNHSMFGSIEGLTGGDAISAALNQMYKGELSLRGVAKEMPATRDLEAIYEKWDKDEISAMNDVFNLLVQSSVGVNPQSLTDAVVAIMDFCGDDAQTSRECALLIARVLNCPQSQLDKIYFDELDASGEEASRMTPAEIAERYARYKVRRGAPLTGWAYGNEQREKLMDKYRDRSNTLAKERLSKETDKQASQNMAQWLEEFEATKDRVSEIRKVKSRDEDRYYELLDELEITPEYDRYEIIKGYKRDVDALTTEWLNATTPAQQDSCVQAIIGLKSDMVKELMNTQQ